MLEGNLYIEYTLGYSMKPIKLGNGGTLDPKYVNYCHPFCGYCGKTIADHEKKCPRCGVEFID